MKRQFFALAAAALLAVACGSTESKKSAETKSTDSKEVVADAKSYGVLEFIDAAEGLVGSEVTITATVKHTCKHSGRRCFMYDNADPSTTLRVEAGGEIGGFNAELVGSEITVTGIVMESRVSDEKLATMEKEYEESIAKDGTEAHCGSELKNIQSIRAKLKADGKDYHSTYHLNGTKMTF